MREEVPMNFDTHKSIKFLMEKGIKESQAESIVEVVSKSRSHDFSKLATRDQVKVIEEKLRGEIKSTEEILKGEMKSTEERLKGEIISIKHDILKWLLPLLISIIITIFFKSSI
ncbi:MAG: hypothetical protein HRU36_05665 [Rickettsiales bacterium]|nr:hypothetical protein [Rickettsiales bacterium]